MKSVCIQGWNVKISLDKSCIYNLSSVYILLCIFVRFYGLNIIAANIGGNMQMRLNILVIHPNLHLAGFMNIHFIPGISIQCWEESKCLTFARNLFPCFYWYVLCSLNIRSTEESTFLVLIQYYWWVPLIYSNCIVVLLYKGLLEDGKMKL